MIKINDNGDEKSDDDDDDDDEHKDKNDNNNDPHMYLLPQGVSLNEPESLDPSFASRY